MFSRESEGVHAAWSIILIVIETEGLLKVTGSHLHCKRYDIAETAMKTLLLQIFRVNVS